MSIYAFYVIEALIIGVGMALVYLDYRIHFPKREKGGLNQMAKAKKQTKTAKKSKK